MPARLDAADPAFPSQFAALLAVKREQATDVDHAVAAILADPAGSAAGRRVLPPGDR